MTSDHGPNEIMDADSAIQELRAHAGTQFAPHVVAAFVALDPEDLEAVTIQAESASSTK
jgi:response regulator RpfG family c-di-GMP phosphodiesterase